MGDKKLFVMIDDDTDDHEIFSMALSELVKPLKCLFFKDCESAVAYFSQQSASAPGYVFIDLNLPRIPGDECLVHLQKLQEFDSPRIIVYSGPVPEEWRERFKQIGVDQFIEKTGSISELVGELKQLTALD